MNSEELAKQIRIDALQMTSDGGSSHIGSCLSVADLLAVLYASKMKYTASMPKDEGRDIFIMSKGHAGAALYSALSNSGFFDRSLLKQHYQNGSKFSGHVSHIGIPGVELSTGSLGHGLSVGSGYALGLNKRQEKRNVYVMVSDGEMNEGSVWESIMFSSHHKINNLTLLIDKNNLQSLRSTKETLDLGRLDKKIEEFGWLVINVDGHNHIEILEALNKNSDRPKAIIANTIKGKGVSFMENNVLWHYRTARNEEFKSAMEELRGGS